jgi:DNA invertase Pin-like site-specific DNA recombinase
MASKKRATAALIRVSTRAQATDSDSPQNQRAALAAAGATVFYEYVGSGYKGDGAPRRASLQPVFDAIAAGQIERLLVTDISRASRSGRVTDELIRHCDQHGVEFLAGGMAFSHGTSTGWFTARQMSDIAELQSRQQSEKIRNGQAAALARGLPVTGNLPWHLQRDPDDRHKAIPGPGWDDARQAATRYIAGEWSAQQVAEYLHTRHGVMRTTSSVLSWLRSHGIRGHHGHHRGPVLISNCYPALVNDEEAQALDRRIAANRWGNGGKRRHSYSLSGVCTCHHCGQKLVCSTTRNSTGKEYSYVRCNSPGCTAAKHRIPHHALEDWLVLIRLGPELARIQEHRESAAAIVAPSAELLNQRQRVAALQKLLGQFDSPGARADLEQAQQRLAALEPRPMARAERTLLQALRIGSDAWWAESSTAQKNTELLAVIEEARVDLTAWPLPAAPPVPAGPLFGEQLKALEPRGQWQRGCAAALVPVLTLRG